jgi:hypothetical protein
MTLNACAVVVLMVLLCHFELSVDLFAILVIGGAYAYWSETKKMNAFQKECGDRAARCEEKLDKLLKLLETEQVRR